jgi:hypothetical protein
MHAMELISPGKAGFNAPTLQAIKEAQELVDMLDKYLSFAEPQLQILDHVIDIENIDLSSIPMEGIAFLRNVTKIYSLIVHQQTEADIKVAANKWACTHKSKIESRVHRLLAVLSTVDGFMSSISDQIIELHGDDVRYDVEELKASVESDAFLIPENLSFEQFDALMSA